jgi:hypothetical protein
MLNTSGTISARSSKSVVISAHSDRLIFTFDDTWSVRALPIEGDIVVEISENVMNGLKVTPFSRFHHLSLPSVLMNLDVLVHSVQTPKFDNKVALNRTLSTAVPSPVSTPSRQSTIVSSASAARTACLVASVIRSWRCSGEQIRARNLKSSGLSSRPFELVKRGRFGECLVIVSGLSIPVDHLDIEWQSIKHSSDSCNGPEVNLTKSEAYSKFVTTAKTILNCSDNSSRSDILEAVGPYQSDMTILLAGAVLLNNLEEEKFARSPSFLVVS